MYNSNFSKSVTMLLAAVSLSLCSAAQTVTIDPSVTYQVIDGFGASTAWHGAISDIEARVAFGNDSTDELGLSILRIKN